jgi:protein ImuB
MRIACFTLPGFLLQVHARSAPHLVGTSFGVLAETEGKVARVVACSRRAREEGVKEGMTATQARAVAPRVTLIDAQPAAYRQGMQAAGEALLASSVTVDVDQLGTAYALVPPRASGHSFAERAIEALRRLGLMARAGVADDRFTAWAATQATPHEQVRVVAHGGSAAFLRPLPLSLLPLDGDVRRTLALLGVRTVGDFAALPPPSVGRRWSETAVDVQALARGEDRRPLCAFVPEETIQERLELEEEIAELEPLLFLTRPLLDRACQRVVGRGRAAARVLVTLRGEGKATEALLAPSRPTPSSRLLLDLLRAHLAERILDHPVQALEAAVTEEGRLEAQELDLLDRAAPSPDAVDRTVARLRAAFGEGAAFAAVLEDRYRPEAAWSLTSFDPSPPRRRRGRATPRPDALPPTAPAELPRAGQAALRLLDPPTPADVDGQLARGATLVMDGHRHAVTELSGPSRLEGEWWTDAPLGRDYYEVETEDGGHYWLFRNHVDGRIYLQGIFD